jgi:hypothetical protein
MKYDFRLVITNQPYTEIERELDENGADGFRIVAVKGELIFMQREAEESRVVCG